MCGPGSPPLLGITIGQGVDIAADTFGDREGLVVSQQGIRRNFTQLKQEIDMLAAGFLELGLVPGDRLGIWGPNTHEWYLTQVCHASKPLLSYLAIVCCSQGRSDTCQYQPCLPTS